jgi:hypothetical protein
VPTGVRQRSKTALQLTNLFRGEAHLRRSLSLGLDEHRGGLLQDESARYFLINRAGCVARWFTPPPPSVNRPEREGLARQDVTAWTTRYIMLVSVMGIEVAAEGTGAAVAPASKGTGGASVGALMARPWHLQ